jgi:hypothetical protein
MSDSTQSPLFVAHLGRAEDDPSGLAALSAEFALRNPGYAVSKVRDGLELAAAPMARALFITRGEAHAEVNRESAGLQTSAVCAGDLLWLRAGDSLALDVPCELICFEVSGELPAELPSFIRPDHDPLITDTPGGCAEEERAYRRILVTWLAESGPYTFDGLNAHRVRMWNSFSHYHPPEGGFDELYIVEDVADGGKIYTSDQRVSIEASGELSAESAGQLIQTLIPERGDLIYIPRGMIHRAVGGVLAQVVTVPGFKPGFEVGVDHHLRSINERLGLEGVKALPFQESAADGPLIK